MKLKLNDIVIESFITKTFESDSPQNSGCKTCNLCDEKTLGSQAPEEVNVC